VNTGYVINAILVLLVARQIRERRLDLQSLVLPLVLVAVAAANYLHAIPTRGNDVVLDLTLIATGITLGTVCALTTHLRRGSDGVALARAGWLAASLWIFGCGARMAFAFATEHGAGPSLARFSISHSISGADAWVAALVLMALAEVTARLVVLQMRAHALTATTQAAATRTPAYGPA
jgi:hypothetical protein